MSIWRQLSTGTLSGTRLWRRNSAGTDALGGLKTRFFADESVSPGRGKLTADEVTEARPPLAVAFLQLLAKKRKQEISRWSIQLPHARQVTRLPFVFIGHNCAQSDLI